MTFNSVISSLRAGRAAYTPSMRGYLCRIDETPSGSQEGVESIAHFVFKENADVDPYNPGSAGDSVNEYSFTRFTHTNGTVSWKAPNVDSGESVNPAGDRNVRKDFVLDAQMFAALASSDWEIVDTSAAEQRRTELNTVSRW